MPCGRLWGQPVASVDAAQPTPGNGWNLIRALGRSLIWVIAAAVLILLIATIIVAALGDRDQLGKLITLALPSFVAGALSALSPCSLPILLGFFSIAFQNDRSRIGPVTAAFLLGAGTTMAVLGAGFTALGSFAIDHQDTLVTVGGILIIGFGLLTLSGRGFSGVHVSHRGGTSPGAAYLFGLLFALGWTACVGPILGSILTLLVTTGSTVNQASALTSGAALALIYVVGLGLPILIAVFGLSEGLGVRDVFGGVRGRTLGFTIGSWHWEAPITTVISGGLMIVLGWLLLNGAMIRITEQFGSSWLAQWVVQIESHLPGA